MTYPEAGFAPAWPAPANVGAFITYRRGGYSPEPYRSNNLGTHVGDDPEAVDRNRQQLSQQLGIAPPCWLEQVHGTDIAEAGHFTTHSTTHSTTPPAVDGSFSHRPGMVCAVLTADCLPLLLCDRFGGQVAAVHCGWRGLAGGIIDRILAAFDREAPDLLAYLGPAISQRHYEVGRDVQAALSASVSLSPKFSQAVTNKPGHFMVDLVAVARAQLRERGVTQIYGGERCTFAEADAFYSYRRDGVTGRMASLIWLKSAANLQSVVGPPI
ncbi:MAG: peptidoglycan editing factor PgeF [Cellvibrionaceae bacterium]